MTTATNELPQSYLFRGRPAWAGRRQFPESELPAEAGATKSRSRPPSLREDAVIRFTRASGVPQTILSKRRVFSQEESRVASPPDPLIPMPIAPEQLLGCWALGMGTTLYDYDYD